MSKLLEYLKRLEEFLYNNTYLIYILIGFSLYFLFIFGIIGFFMSISFLRTTNDCCEYVSLIKILFYTYFALFINFLIFYKLSLELIITLSVVAIAFSISYVTINFLLCFIKCYTDSFGLWLILFSHSVVFGFLLTGVGVYIVYRISFIFYNKHYASNTESKNEEDLKIN